MPDFASSLAVNPSFSQLAGAKAVGSKRWGSISFSEMEKLERVFWSQLEMTSKSLWLLSGILSMLKRDGFQPADPTLFNAALASASATLSQQARSSASGSTFLRAKRRDSLLAHTAIPVPETQRRSLTVSPGSETLLFDEEMLGVVVSQVQQSSLISSNLAMSRSLARGRGRSSSSLVVDPSPASASRSGRPRYKRSSSASLSGGRKRFRGGKGSAPSSGTFGFPEVGAITLPDPVQRLPGPPLAGLEGQGCRALGSGGIAVRLPHSLPVRSSTVHGSHLHAFVPPLVHQGGGAEGSYSGPCGQVRSGTSSPAFSRLLQLAVCCLEDLRVLETRHRSLDPQFVCGRSSLPHGDHPVCTAVSSSGGLDGLHRPQGSLPAGPCPSGLSSLPSVCSSGQCLPVLCPLLRAIHSFSGLHSGHGSCFRHSPLLGYPHEAVPRRLASPVLILRLSPSRSPGSSGSLPRAGDSSQSCKVSPCSISGGTVPQSRDRLPVFPGFAIFGARRQASVNRRRISILRRSARQYLALASRHAVLSLPSGSRWHLRVRSLQLCLHRLWDRGDQSVRIPWS